MLSTALSTEFHKQKYWKLVKFEAKFNLNIANIFFKTKHKIKWTWESPDGVTKNKIDHILVEDLKIMTGVRVILTFHFSSDHRPVVRISLDTFPREMAYECVESILDLKNNSEKQSNLYQ